MKSTTQYEYFLLFFKKSFMKRIREWMSKCAAQIKKSSVFRKSNILRQTDIDICHLKKLLSLTLLMGQVHMPELRNYWSTNELYSHPIFSKIISRNKYELILYCLCFYDKTDDITC